MIWNSIPISKMHIGTKDGNKLTYCCKNFTFCSLEKTETYFIKGKVKKATVI